MKRHDLTTMDAKQLAEYVDKSRTDLANMRRNIGLGQETKTAELRGLRKDIARGLTLLASKEEK